MPDSAQTPIVERFVLGPFETNCYVVSAPGSDSCWIVDAGYGPDAMIERIRERGQRVGAVVLTHAHADHIAGLDEIIGAFPGVPVFLHPSERAWLRDPELNLSGFAGTPLVCDAEATGELSDGQALELLGRDVARAAHAGALAGGVTLVLESVGESGAHVAFVGDTLFAGSIGRSDFPTSDEAALHRSIRERLYTLDEDTTALPGHGPPTTIGREKRSNPFVRS